MFCGSLLLNTFLICSLFFQLTCFLNYYSYLMKYCHTAAKNQPSRSRSSSTFASRSGYRSGSHDQQESLLNSKPSQQSHRSDNKDKSNSSKNASGKLLYYAMSLLFLSSILFLFITHTNSYTAAYRCIAGNSSKG